MSMTFREIAAWLAVAVMVVTAVWAAALQGGMITALSTLSGSAGVVATILGVQVKTAAPAVPPANPTPKGP
jgi:hypothetical protein